MKRYRATRRLFVVLLVFGLLLGGSLAAVNALIDRPEASTQAVTVRVPEGVGAGGVADLLVDAGVIDNAFLFKLQARFDERANRIRPGRYQLRPGMSTDAILAALSAVPEEAPTFRVTIAEGLTVDETLAKIAQAPGSPFGKRELRKALSAVALPAWVPQDLPPGSEPFEGLLFPNTYEFRRDSEAQDVVAQLVAETREVMAGVKAPDGLAPYEVLTMASLIEREARLEQERAKIASVIHNRLEQGIPLQIDATVLYALGEHKEQVTLEDLEVDSPWNTYEVTGLPPTPISASGEAAVRAAADPAKTDFLYYVVVDPETGRHAFSETYEEFLENKRKAQGD